MGTSAEAVCGGLERGTRRSAEAIGRTSPHSAAALVPLVEPYFAAFAVAAFATAATMRVSDRRSRRSITSAGE